MTKELTEKNICPNNSSNLANWVKIRVEIGGFFLYCYCCFSAGPCTDTRLLQKYFISTMLYHSCLYISQAYLSLHLYTLDFGYRGQNLTCATIFAHRKQEYFQFIFFLLYFKYGWTFKPTRILPISSGSWLLICLMLVFHENSHCFRLHSNIWNLKSNS